MPIRPEDLLTGGALQGAVARSLLRARDAPAQLEAGMVLGPYRVLRELGRGGMAQVYLAERADGEYRQQVALKWMQGANPDANSEALFRRERQALADLRHPNIAQLLDGGCTAEGRLWFAMEFIEGEQLDRHCVQAALPLGQRLALFRQVCSAVAFAHARGILHRDIKPSNVLVDREGRARLLDFGIAQLLGEEDRLAAGAYTPGFASPEQTRGETLTVASDVFQLGRLLAVLLCGDETERETLLRAVEATPEAPAEHPPASALTPGHVPADLQAVVACATAREPEGRYATVDALAADVGAFLVQRPISARAATAGYLLDRFVARHRLAVVASGLLLVAAISLVALFTWRLAQERDRSLQAAERAETGERFLISLFRVADPGVGSGARTTVAELLEEGAERLQADAALAPQTRARLLLSLAQVQFNLGEYARAESLAQAVQAVDPGSYPAFSASALQLWILQRRGDPAGAVARAPAVLATLDGAAQYDRVRASVLNVAGRSASQIGDPRARQWLEDALAAGQRAGDQEAQGQALRGLGFQSELEGDYLGALAATSEAAERIVEALGPRSPEAFSARTHSIYLMLETGQAEPAWARFQQLAPEIEQVLEPEHIARIYFDITGGYVLRALGQGEAALVLAQPAAQRCLAALGEQHFQCGTAMQNVGVLLLDLQRPDEALPWLQRLVDARRASMGESHIYTAYAEQWLAHAQCLAGDRGEGLALIERVSERFARDLPANSADHALAAATRQVCGG